MSFEPFLSPTRAGLDPRLLTVAEVLVLNGDGTVDVRVTTSRATRARVPVCVGITPALGDRVVLAHLNGDPQLPLVLASLTAPVLPG